MGKSLVHPGVRRCLMSDCSYERRDVRGGCWETGGRGGGGVRTDLWKCRIIRSKDPDTVEVPPERRESKLREGSGIFIVREIRQE